MDVTHRAAGTLAFALLGLLALVPGAPATFPGGNGKIAYHTSWVGPHTYFRPPDIYTIAPNGSGEIRLSTDERSHSPVWSPDGARIAFASSRDRSDYRNDIYTMNADGSDVRRLTTTPENDYDAVWSPDGERIAFVSFHEPTENCPSSIGCNYEIFVVGADGGGLTRLTDTSGIDREPAWSSDGTKILFASKRSGNYDIYSIGRDGSGLTRVTTDPLDEGNPQWSPRGDEISFERDHPASPYTVAPHIYIAPPNGTGERRLLSSGPFGEREAAWSPDGRRIAFVAIAGQNQIHAINADGTGHVALTDDQTPDPNYFLVIVNREPTWSPDGEKIAFTHTECPWYCGYSELHIVNSDGSGGRTKISSNAVTAPDWQPLSGPRRGDYKNAAQFCKAQREFLGDDAFHRRYGGGANAHGKCVSADRR